MYTAEEFILEREGRQKEVMLFLHEFLTSIPTITSKIRYKIPFYYAKSWICYLNPQKEGSVELAFTRGNELSNGQGLLQSHGRKQVLGITFSRVEDIPTEVLSEIVHEALVLDETTPYASKRTPKTNARRG